jgi:hypothetical protein
MTATMLTRRSLLKSAAAAGGLGMPLVHGAYAAGKLSCGFWDHWVPGANEPLSGRRDHPPVLVILGVPYPPLPVIKIGDHTVVANCSDTAGDVEQLIARSARGRPSTVLHQRRTAEFGTGVHMARMPGNDIRRSTGASQDYCVITRAAL